MAAGHGTTIAHWMGGFASAFFPPACPLCRAATGRPHAVCAACWTRLRFIEPPYCAILGTPFATDAGAEAVSPQALAEPPAFRRMRAALLYDEAAGRLVSALKYGDRLDLAPMMAGWMRRAGDRMLQDADLVVPVPLHPFRLLRRRFNQSSELARRIADAADRRFAATALQRTRHTKRQVGLGATQRQENVRGAFRVAEARRGLVEGRRILLVDDVFTTGATAQAATRALMRAGASHVDLLVFARVAAGR